MDRRMPTPRHVATHAHWGLAHRFHRCCLRGGAFHGQEPDSRFLGWQRFSRHGARHSVCLIDRLDHCPCRLETSPVVRLPSQARCRPQFLCGVVCSWSPLDLCFHPVAQLRQFCLVALARPMRGGVAREGRALLASIPRLVVFRYRHHVRCLLGPLPVGASTDGTPGGGHRSLLVAMELRALVGLQGLLLVGHVLGIVRAIGTSLVGRRLPLSPSGHRLRPQLRPRVPRRADAALVARHSMAHGRHDGSRFDARSCQRLGGALGALAAAHR
mmetsp:Transcript_36057/g.103709  ORF Transcript_36057/g.103709 Transcript_36057/m.103709 type:complete len:271 (-) Transcript_36057:295-1107(-)